jgi:hypothetical protein
MELGDVRAAIKATLLDRIAGAPPDKLSAYDTVSSAALLPAVVVVPRAAVYEPSMGLGVDDTFEFDLAVLCSTASDELGQRQLDRFLSGAGPRSIRQAIFLSRETGRPPRQLGLPNCKARVLRMDGYGMTFDDATGSHVGALLRLQVVLAATPTTP